jgi:hypothetical protein
MQALSYPCQWLNRGAPLLAVGSDLVIDSSPVTILFTGLCHFGAKPSPNAFVVSKTSNNESGDLNTHAPTDSNERGLKSKRASVYALTPGFPYLLGGFLGNVPSREKEHLHVRRSDTDLQ